MTNKECTKIHPPLRAKQNPPRSLSLSPCRQHDSSLAREHQSVVGERAAVIQQRLAVVAVGLPVDALQAGDGLGAVGVDERLLLGRAHRLIAARLGEPDS